MKRLILSLFALTVIGCGNKGGGSGEPAVVALNKDQKARFTNVLGSIGSTQNAALEAKNPGSTTQKIQAKATEVEVKMADKMSSACEKVDVTKPDPTKLVDPLNQEYNYAIEVSGGAHCPVEMMIKVHATNKTDPNAGTFARQATSESHYAVKSDEVKGMNDVFAYDTKMSENTELKSTANGATLTGSGEMSGTIRSAKEGDITITGTLSASGTMKEKEGEIVTETLINFKFPDMVVVIKVVHKENAKHEGTTEYTVNGEKMSEEEFKAMMSKAGPALGGSGS